MGVRPSLFLLTYCELGSQPPAATGIKSHAHAVEFSEREKGFFPEKAESERLTRQDVSFASAEIWTLNCPNSLFHMALAAMCQTLFGLGFLRCPQCHRQ